MKGKLCLWLLSLTMLTACDDAGLCRRDVERSSLSPERSYTVDIVVVDCGATTTEARRVVIHETGKDTKSDKPVAVFDHTQSVEITWLSKNELHIDARGGRAYNRANLWRDVKVTYSNVDTR